jgi:hypothetical protein
MRQAILLATLIIAGSSVARSQTSFNHVGYGQDERKSSAARRCTGAYLSLRRVGDDAGAGQRAVIFAFTNTALSPCTLYGHPGFSMLNRAGQPLRGAHVGKNGEEAQVVTLAPGGKAWFEITFSACGVGGTGVRCPTSAKVRITAPGTRRAFVLRERLEPYRGRVNVSPVQSTQPGE